MSKFYVDLVVSCVFILTKTIFFLSFQEEEAAPERVKTSFTVKLTKFDDKQKVPLIKEIKNLIPGMNLVQVNI